MAATASPSNPKMIFYTFTLYFIYLCIGNFSKGGYYCHTRIIVQVEFSSQGDYVENTYSTKYYWIA